MGRSQEVAIRLSKMVVMIAVCAQIGGMVGVSSGAGGGGGALREQCTQQVQQLGNCLMFASGKAAEPTKECCTSITTMKNTHPVCLCFFIEEAHNGSNQGLRSLGIQEAKLLQLPTACHLVGANVTDCPKLLGISPSSPLAAIFTNSNATATNSSSSATSTDDKSDGFKRVGNGVVLIGSLIVTVLITIIPIAAL